MTTYTEGFELSDETVLTTSNTWWTAINGAWKADTARAMVGSASARCDRVASTSSTCVKTGLSSTTAKFVGYFYFTAASTQDNGLIKFYDGANKVIDFYWISNSKLRLVDDTGILWTSTETMPLDEWVRIEIEATAATSNATLNVAFYPGSSETATDSFSTSTANTGTVFDQIQVGVGSSGYADDYWIDALSFDDAWDVGAGVATYDLTITHDTDSAAVADRTYEIDSTGSTGVTSLTQTAGTTASVTESPTGVFTFSDPGGTDDLVFDLDANGSTDDSIEITIPRASATRPAILTLATGGDPDDINDWG